MWINDLEEFQKEYIVYKSKREASMTSNDTKKVKTKKKKLKLKLKKKSKSGDSNSDVSSIASSIV